MKVRLDDGAELFYTIDDFTDPWTQPETVVLHHGMAKNHKLWYAWVPILAQHYRVVRFDMRGMGQSSVPEPGYPWSLENFAKDLLGLLDQLELPRVHLIGETVGGSIAMRFATLAPGPSVVAGRLYLPCDVRCPPYGKCRDDRPRGRCRLGGTHHQAAFGPATGPSGVYPLVCRTNGRDHCPRGQ